MLGVYLLRRVALLTIISMLLVYAVLAYQLRTRVAAGYSDFVSAYTAAKILQRGGGSGLYDLQLQYAIQREAAPHAESRQGALPYVRPPFEAWLFRPLARFSYLTAFAIWTAISLAILIGSMALFRREVPQLAAEWPAVLVLAALSFFPVFLCLLQGQDSLLLLLIYVLTYVALLRDRSLIAGAILSLGTFKFPLVLPFVILFTLARRWRFLAGFAIGAAILTAVSVATVGWSGMTAYISYLANIDKLAPTVNVPRDMPNLRGLLAVCAPSLMMSRVGLVALALVSVGLIGFTASRSYGRHMSLQDTFSLALLATLLVSYHAHVFDLVLLIVPICLALRAVSNEDASGRNRALAWAAGLSAFSPLYIAVAMGLHAAGLLAILPLIFLIALARVNSPVTAVAR